MSSLPFEKCDFEVRQNLVDAYQEVWVKVADAGIWLDSERRLAIVAEIRCALDCAFCSESKGALSPNRNWHPYNHRRVK